jgi:hypothetical protein
MSQREQRCANEGGHQSPACDCLLMERAEWGSPLAGGMAEGASELGTRPATARPRPDGRSDLPDEA